MKSLLLVCAVSLPALCHAQATLLVGPGGFATANAAYSAASPGDVILFSPGTYALPLIIDKAVTFRSITYGTVTCVSSFGTLPCFINTVYGPGAAGGTVHFQGLQFTIGINAFLAGQLVLEDCTLMPTSSTALAVLGGSAHLQRCQLATTLGSIGRIDALRATNCHLTIAVAGIHSQDTGSRGIALVRSTLHANGLVVHATGAPALEADALSTAWLSNSTVSAAQSPCAIIGGRVHAARFAHAPDCGNVFTGSPVSAAGEPLIVGSTAQFLFTTEPLHLVGVFASTRLTAPIWFGAEQPLVLDPANIGLFALQAADASGEVAASWAIPPSPSLVNQAFWFQAVDFMTVPLQLSPLVGGIVH